MTMLKSLLKINQRNVYVSFFNNIDNMGVNSVSLSKIVFSKKKVAMPST